MLAALAEMSRLFRSRQFAIAAAGPFRYLDRSAPVAQLDRALPSEGRGHKFESCRARHDFKDLLVISRRSVPGVSRGTSAAEPCIWRCIPWMSECGRGR